MSTAEPAIAQKAPYKVDLKANHHDAWCACGLSRNQPFCDGSHTRTKTGIKPFVWTHEKDETVYLCGCKRTDGKPFCDGSHKKL